jgi:hypothetical protein
MSEGGKLITGALVESAFGYRGDSFDIRLFQF